MQTGLDADDLFQEGMMAADRAMMRHDPDAGATIKTWGTSKARYGILDYITAHFGRRGRANELKGKLLKAVSTDSLGSTEESSSFEFLKAVDECVEARLDFDLWLATLHGRDHWVITSKIEGKSLVEIGEELGISDSRVCQVLGKLRREFTARSA